MFFAGESCVVDLWKIGENVFIFLSWYELHSWTLKPHEIHVTLNIIIIVNALRQGLNGQHRFRQHLEVHSLHYNDIIMSTMASQITSVTIVYSTVYSRRKSKKTSKLHITGLCEGNSLVTSEFPAQRASNAENVSIWWRHHVNENLSLSTLSTVRAVTRPISRIPQSIRKISHNAPFCNRNVHTCTFLLQQGAFWDMGLVHSGICELP